MAKKLWVKQQRTWWSFTIWLVVWTWFLWLSTYYGNGKLSQLTKLTPSFFTGVGQPPTRLSLTIINHIITININHILIVYYQPMVGGSTTNQSWFMGWSAGGDDGWIATYGESATHRSLWNRLGVPTARKFRGLNHPEHGEGVFFRCFLFID